jgi:SPP1 gp7 family putative phage head morphogenesis protein
VIDVDLALDAADRLLAEYGFAPLEKAERNPLKPSGFDAIVLDALGTLKKAAKPGEQEALKSMLQQLERQWGGLSAAERTTAIDQAAKSYLKIARDVAPKVAPLIKNQASAVVLATKMAADAEFKLGIHPNLDAADMVAVTFTAASQANFIRNQYGVRVARYSQLARDIVADGLEKGLDRHDVGENLSKAFYQTDVARSDAYWRVIASTFVARSRAYSTLRSFDEAGITAFQFEAVMDEVTTEICRFMHGKVFPVAQAMKTMMDTESDADPESVVERQPWVGQGKTEDGTMALFYKSQGQRKLVCRVDSPGYGSVDKAGTYSHGMSNQQLSTAGMTTPPLHGHCRSTLVPVFGTIHTRVPETPSPEPTPAPPPKLAPPRKLPPANLPENLADLVRPLPVGDYETAGELGAASSAAAAASTAVNNALEALDKAPLAYDWSKDFILGAVQGAEQAVVPQAALAHASTIKAAIAKSPLVDVPISELVNPKNWKISTAAYKPSVADNITNKVKHTKPIVVVKLNGKFYVQSGKDVLHIENVNNVATAAQLKGETTVQAHVIDGDAKAAKPKAPPKPKTPKVKPENFVPVPGGPDDLSKWPEAKPAAPPPPPLPKATGDVSADVILHQKTGEARGSNSGGFYTGSDGVKRYVKWYDDPTQAHSEHLANSIYRELGLEAPESQVFVKDGKVGYASKLFEGGKTLKELGGPNEAQAKEFMKGFVGDVLTGNWDAIGTGNDNAMLLASGRIARIDNGGTFLFRAKAGRKNAAVLNDITEWDKFFSPTNPYYSAAAAKAGIHSAEDIAVQELQASLAAVRRVQNSAGGWAKYVERVSPGMKEADKAQIVKMLESRTNLIEERVAELSKPKPPPPKPGELQQFSTVVPGPKLTKSDLPTHTLMHQTAKDAAKAMSAGKIPQTGETIDAFVGRAGREIKKAGSSEQAAIRAFTNGEYSSIRASEEQGNPSKSAQNILRAYDKVQPAPEMAVYRGIRLHDSSVAASVLDFHLKTKEWGFGRGGAGATTSTSWNVEKAFSFGGVSMTGSDALTTQASLSIVYKIKNKFGIAIETVSAYNSEREVLMKSTARFRTTGLSWAKGSNNRVLIVEAEEIE